MLCYNKAWNEWKENGAENICSVLLALLMVLLLFFFSVSFRHSKFENIKWIAFYTPSHSIVASLHCSEFIPIRLVYIQCITCRGDRLYNLYMERSVQNQWKWGETNQINKKKNISNGNKVQTRLNKQFIYFIICYLHIHILCNRLNTWLYSYNVRLEYFISGISAIL